VVGRTTYSISVVNGERDDIPQSEYVPDLIGAMDIIATEVAADVGDSLPGGRRLVVLLRRKLTIRVDSPTSVDAIIDAGGWTTDPDLNEDGIFVIGGKVLWIARSLWKCRSCSHCFSENHPLPVLS
jgi:hypothetical protein